VLALRAVIFEVEELGRYDGAASSGLLGGRSVEVHLSVQRIARLGLLVQRLPERAAEAVWEPALLVESVGTPLCRFHSGDDPLYCPRPAATRDGYCREHSRSWKALYERCAQGDDSACSEVAPLVREEFAVYALDYGGARLKVGLTQLWRFPWRVAEQPHAAAVLLSTGGLAEMRELERRLGRMRSATEGAGARREERARRAASLLARGDYGALAARLAALLAELGVEGEYHAVTILPRRLRPADFVGRAAAPPIGRRVGLLDYWAGLLALEGERAELTLVDKKSLLHRALEATVQAR